MEHIGEAKNRVPGGACKGLYRLYHNGYHRSSISGLDWVGLGIRNDLCLGLATGTDAGLTDQE